MSGLQHYHHRRRSSSSTRALSESQPASLYPGVHSYADLPTDAGVSSFYPYPSPVQPSIAPIEVNPGAAASLPFAPSAAAPVPASSGGGLGGLLGGLNLGNLDMKGIVEKLGGIDGILSNIGKFQKVMQSFQQLAPMMQLFAGAFKKGGAASLTEKSDDFEYVPPRRRTSKSGKRRSGSHRTSSGRRKRRRS